MRLTEQQGLTKQGTERFILKAAEGPWRCEAEEWSGRSRQGSETMLAAGGRGRRGGKLEAGQTQPGLLMPFLGGKAGSRCSQMAISSDKSQRSFNCLPPPSTRESAEEVMPAAITAPVSHPQGGPGPERRTKVL